MPPTTSQKTKICREDWFFLCIEFACWVATLFVFSFWIDARLDAAIDAYGVECERPREVEIHHAFSQGEKA